MFEMLFTIAAVLVVLWLLGFVSSYTFGGYIHVLLVVALIVLILGFFQGRSRRA
jgi:hypothetical protein